VAQAKLFETWLGICCDLYNAALQERRDAWRLLRRQVTLNDQYRQLTEVRGADAEVAAIPAWVTRSPLLHVERAIATFVARRQRGELVGYPRFRARKRYDTFTFPFTSVRDRAVHVPTLGSVRFVKHRDFRGDPRQVRIMRRADHWYVGIVCDVGDAPAKLPVRSAVGIDLGLHSFATLSDGTEVENPRFFRRAEKRLSCAQRVLARKGSVSRGRQRARVQLARQLRKVKNQRRDFAYKLTRALFLKYDMIAHEALNIVGLAQGICRKSVGDAGWGQFIRILSCKAEEAGKTVVAVDPSGTSQRCSTCGVVVAKTLGERVHACSTCGSVLGRDHNAALNILALGRSAVAVRAEALS